MKDTLIQMVKEKKVPYSKDYQFNEFLAKPIEFLRWSQKGLPDD
jgi:hypothetical protein